MFLLLEWICIIFIDVRCGKWLRNWLSPTPQLQKTACFTLCSVTVVLLFKCSILKTVFVSSLKEHSDYLNSVLWSAFRKNTLRRYWVISKSNNVHIWVCTWYHTVHSQILNLNIKHIYVHCVHTCHVLFDSRKANYIPVNI